MENNTTPINTSAVEELRKEFIEFWRTCFKIEGNNGKSVIYSMNKGVNDVFDFFLTHASTTSDSTLREVMESVEKLPSYYGNPKHNEMIYRADVLALLAKRIEK